MGKQEAISAAVDAETLGDLRRLAEHMNCSIDHLVTTAVLRFVGEEMGAITPDEFAHIPPFVSTDPTSRALHDAEHEARVAMRAFLKVGEDAVERGEVFSQEEMELWFAERVAARSQAATAE